MKEARSWGLRGVSPCSLSSRSGIRFVGSVSFMRRRADAGLDQMRPFTIGFQAACDQPPRFQHHSSIACSIILA
jgi:hypothetical protein